MEIIRGKHASFLDASAFAQRLVGYKHIHMDIGTGDGRFVQHLAQMCPDNLVIGIDAARENLHRVARCAPPNAMFVIANARSLPSELQGLVQHITINFPWGSLLAGLLTGDPALLAGLTMISRLNSTLEVRLNAGALAEADWTLEAGACRVREVLAINGFVMQQANALELHDLKSFPTTWAKRLAFGRDPRAVYLRGTRKIERIAQSA